MIIVKTVKELQQILSAEKAGGKKIGFVPTMGALHQGHMSLIETAKKNTDFVVASVFVNPTQFNDANDFEKYPLKTEEDAILLEQHHCDLLFLPSVSEMYPNGKELKKKYNLGRIEQLLEGSFRAGHFQGVCQVVNLLLDYVQPDILFMGQKDYQQIKVILKMLAEKKIDVQLFMVPILRATDGLAFSSRNARLSEDAKMKATILHKCLLETKENLQKYSQTELEKQAKSNILANGFTSIDYYSICNQDDLEAWDGKQKAVALTAAWIDGVRLIDNMELN